MKRGSLPKPAPTKILEADESVYVNLFALQIVVGSGCY
jgi:hypothetical protein